MEVLKKIDLKNVLVLDIETARLHKELPLDSPDFDSWAYKVNKTGEMTDKEIQESYVREAALYPEFSRVLCITIGVINKDKLRTKTYADADEEVLLMKFNNDLGQFQGNNSKLMLGGHAIKGFDAPFIAKRSIINGVTPHSLLDVFGKKPWDVDAQLLDTKVIWQGTGFNPSSLINIATAFKVPNPKSDISGADVGRVYYEEGESGMLRIIKYCERDVLATANVLRKMKFETLLELESTDEIKVDKLPIVVNLNNGGPFEKKEQKALKDVFKLIPADEVDAAIEVLNAIAAKKSTKLTKKFVTELKKEYA